MKYSTPFIVKDSIIYDNEGRKVKLWGVNYYAPFNHNYYNIKELGKNHFCAIDEDIRHLLMLGVDLIRLHIFDREITNRYGNIIESHQMEVFDYLIDQCAKNGIFLMLTPMTWWNTIGNQLAQERDYAYWFIDTEDAIGFSNYYSHDSMIWDPDAIACQKIYYNELFSRKNLFSGKSLAEYSNIVVIELFNETPCIQEWQLEREPSVTAKTMHNAAKSRGKQRKKLIEMWNKYCDNDKNTSSDSTQFSRFSASLMKDYFSAIIPIVDQYFGKNVLKAQYLPKPTHIPDELKQIFGQAKLDAYTIGTYLSASALFFDAENANHANFFVFAKKWFEAFSDYDFGDRAKISYEFDAVSTQNGYPLAAIAAIYAKCDVQIAAYFTYTPAAIAAWNPGWLIHYMNIAHTPSKAAGFAAAGEIFRNNNADNEIEICEDAWSGNNYKIERMNDYVSFDGSTTFRYSTRNSITLNDISKIEIVSGCGNSCFASCDGNGFYWLKKIASDKWHLILFPVQQYISEPERGKTFKNMANRYINCLTEKPISMLREDKIRFRLKPYSIINAKRKNDGYIINANDDGEMLAFPGEYTLHVSANIKEPIPHTLNKNWAIFLHAISPDAFDAIPDFLKSTSGDNIYPRIVALENNTINLADLNNGKFGTKDTAILYNSFSCKESGVMMAGFSADWWMDIYVNGKKIFSTMRDGNSSKNFSANDHIIEFPVQKGKNVLAAKVISGSDGWKFVCG